MADDPGFIEDVKRAARAWRGSPLVPGIYLLTAAVSCAMVLLHPTAPHACAQKVLGQCPARASHLYSLVWWLATPLWVFSVGLSGTTRLWYLSRFNGQDLSTADVWSKSWSFFGRYVKLGLVVVGLSLPAFVGVFVLLAHHEDTWGLALLSLIFVFGDVLLTFVTPGLALYTPSVRGALSGGLSLLRQTWPACAAYALVPPLALTVLGRGISRGHFQALALVGALTGPPLTLLFAGATVAFLLRRFEPWSERGAVGPPLLAPSSLKTSAETIWHRSGNSSRRGWTPFFTQGTRRR